VKWNLRLAAANRGIWKASELQRMLADRGLVISAGKMSGLWSGNPNVVKLQDLDVICAVLAESRNCSSRSPAPSQRPSRRQKARRPRTAQRGRRWSRAASPGGRCHRDELPSLPGAAARCQPP
jgi:DNA-binding Xre family transcriptional regulator